jgi:hypothetical protein
MDEDRIRAAILARRRLVRVYRFPERAPEWPEIMSDLADAAKYFESLSELTADQALDYRRVRLALKMW